MTHRTSAWVDCRYSVREGLAACRPMIEKSIRLKSARPNPLKDRMISTSARHAPIGSNWVGLNILDLGTGTFLEKPGRIEIGLTHLNLSATATA